MMSSKPWGGRFSQGTDPLVEEFTASISFDQALYRYDIQGSIAHTRMLAKVGILTEEEAKAIVRGLLEIQQEIEAGSFPFSLELEDIHMNIERRLAERIGPVAGKLHTARSRNDQVALDLRLYLREEIGQIDRSLIDLQEALVEMAERYIEVILPGYTHLQRAQPILFSHHLLAYHEMLKRDRQRYADCLKRVEVCPLGAGALAGTSLPIDRFHTAELLGFPEVTHNSLDSVGDRDFALEFLAASAILMMHLSRLCEEWILWSSAEFNFLEIADAFCTGSSLMPQKKNPDVLELVRGKSGRVYGSLVSLLTTMKGLPLAYNKDLQEDKEPIFDAVRTVKASLNVLTCLLPHVRPKEEVMHRAAQGGFMTATDLVEYLVNRGVPLRQAHEIVGRMVRYCLEQNRELEELSWEEAVGFSPALQPDFKQWLSLERSVEGKRSYGGTARERVMERIREIRSS
ncbi:MAG: argininosuccinate lyase [Nitrospinae bacterium]|nr:argininosuccinate lyase [Nitrospinota bacterium]